LLFVRVRDNSEDHSDDATLKIGVIKDDQTVKLLSTHSVDWFTTETRFKFEEELGEVLDSTVIIDKILPFQSDLNDLIQSQVTFHAKITGSNQLVRIDAIDRDLDSGDPEVDLFLAKYGIKGRTIAAVAPQDNVLQVAFIVTSAVLILISGTLATSVYCLKQRLSRNKRVERAMEETFSGIERPSKSGVPSNYKTNENPLYDLSNNEPTLNIGNVYESTDDVEDNIDNNAIDNNVVANHEVPPSSCGSSIGSEFQIDFPMPDENAGDLSKQQLVTEDMKQQQQQQQQLSFALKDTTL